MKLVGQARNEHGYAMAVLLVTLSIMAIMLTVAMPVWKQMAIREKEEELIFRGQQYMHAIALFQRKTANAYPPNIDLLVRERYLRKKYKDPITNDDFLPLPVGASAGSPGAAGSSASAGSSSPGQRQSGIGGAGFQPSSSTQSSGGRQGPTPTPFGAPSAGTVGGISGVASKSKDKSIRIYNGRTHYNEWAFVFVPQQQAPGGGGVGVGAPGGRGTNPGGAGGIGGRGGQPTRGGPTGPDRRGGPGPGGFGPQRSGFPSGATPIQPVGPGTPRGRF